MKRYPITSSWLTYRLDVTLSEGENEIVIEGVWNWMSFDYIAIAGEGLVGMEDLTTEQHSGPALSENIPNPFSQSTLLEYSLPEQGHALIEVYDINGRNVATLVNENKAAGVHNCRFVAGENLPGGVYFAQLTFNHNTFTRRMVLK